MLKSQYKKAKIKAKQINDHFQYYFYELFKHKDLFQSVEKYCMFVGYPRSGHSLVGSLLDANANIVMANELNALELFKKGVPKRKIYYYLLQNSQKNAKQGRQQTGYSYEVPNQWQGKFKNIKVIGDKKGGVSSRIIRDCPKILDILLNEIDIPVKFIHVTRNPYDNITTIVTHKKIDLEYGINSYFNKCEAVSYLKKQIGKNDILDVSHESLINEPKIVLSQICNFLGLDATNNYLNDCASIIFKSPNQTRFNYQWNNKWIEQVKRQIDQYEFLQGYSYDH